MGFLRVIPYTKKNPLPQISTTQFNSRSSTSGFMAHLRLRFVYFLQTTEVINFRKQYLKMIIKSGKLFLVEKNLSLGSNYKFGVI